MYTTPFAFANKEVYCVTRTMKVAQQIVDSGLGMLFGKRTGPIEQDILQQLTAGDFLVSFLCSARSTKVMYRTAHQRARARYAAKQAIGRLERAGVIKRIRGKDETVTLTSIGRAMVLKEAAILNSKRRRGMKWDGKWRIVSFDVPQEFKTARDALRHLLRRAGFLQVQKSLYVHPYPCNELVKLLREDRRLASFTFVCTTDSVTAEVMWRRKFDLPDIPAKSR